MRNAKTNQKFEALDVDLERINKTLFQGPTFKKFQEIYKMTSSEFAFSASDDSEVVYLAKAFSEKVRAPFMLGDPFMRDSLLQAAQVTAIHTDSLPIFCEKWNIELHRPSRQYFAEASTVYKPELREFVAEISSSLQNGTVVEALTKMHIRVIKDEADRPRAEAFMLQKENPSVIATDPILQAAEQMRYQTPKGQVVSVTKDADIYSMSSSAKRAQARWPVLFKECRSFGKSVDFQVIVEWMGKMREISLRATNPGVEAYLLNEGFGWVTNNIEVMMLNKMPQHGEIVDCEYWLLPVAGRKDSSIDQRFVWHTTDHSGNRKLFSVGKMRTTWVKLIDHGVVEVAPFPEPVLKVFRPSHSHTEEVEINKDQATLLGENIFTPDLSFGFLKIHEKQFQTSQKDSNLVGNVYFSNYFVWQGEVLNDFLTKLLPELKHSPHSGIPVCINCDINYLRETMPFDTVVVTMAVRQMTKNGIRLVFEYFKKLDDGSLQKSSFSYHDLIWSQSGKDIVPMPLPLEIVKAIKQAAGR